MDIDSSHSRKGPVEDGDAPLDTLIVGGGLSGLSIAAALERAGLRYRLIEARERLGGRISSRAPRGHASSQSVDLGPAWFWPGQPRMAALVRELGLQPFLQHASGELGYEDERGRVHRGRGFSSMEGSYRLVGGFGRLIERLAQRLPRGSVELGCAATRVEVESGQMRTTVERADRAPTVVTSARVVLAIPPRVVAASVELGSCVDARAIEAMRSIPTWMAGNAKVVATYDRPFWREAGLSGDAMSRVGPLVEIHDASPSSGGPYALFGFVGVSVADRRDSRRLLEHVAAQLARIFGAPAGTPLELILQDWATEPQTATPLDHAPLSHHPKYGLPPALSSLCGGQLLLGSTEIAPDFGGYLEGALEAAEHVARRLTGS